MKGNFSFAVVNAGQRNVEVNAELVACSTKGGFRLTGPACKALGVKPGDYVAFLHDEESDTYAIANGFVLKKSNGESQTCTPRAAKTIVKANYSAALESAMQSGDEKLIDAITREGITEDEIVDILAKAMTGEKYQGSKTANPSGAVGIGAPVNFTDSNVWNHLKKGLEKPESINRVYPLDEDDVMEITVNNGFEDITIKALILGEYRDETPARRGADAE